MRDDCKYHIQLEENIKKFRKCLYIRFEKYDDRFQFNFHKNLD